MRILVTGGAGFIGSNLVRKLVGEGHGVLNIDKLTYAGNRRSLADLEGNPLHRLLIADIADAAAMRQAFSDFRPDAVMHLAAESHVDRSIDGPGAFIHTNVIGTFTLLQAAREHWTSRLADLAPGSCSLATSPFRFLHVSTDEVYGSLGEEGAFREDTRYDPHSPYSASKAASDHLARAWARTYGLPILISHCSNTYGPYQFPEKLVPVVILKILRGESIPVYGAGQNVRDWIHVDDTVAALTAVMESGRVGESYNIGGGNERRNLDLVNLLCEILDELHPRADGRPHAESIEFVPDRPGHDLRYAIDSEKIRTELGWRARHALDEGLRSTVRWYLDRSDWWRPILDGSYHLERLGRLSVE